MSGHILTGLLGIRWTEIDRNRLDKLAKRASSAIGSSGLQIGSGLEEDVG